MKLEYSDVKKTAGKLKFRTKAFIDGKFANAASGKTYVSVNPATSQPLTHIASCDGADVDLAVNAQGFPEVDHVVLLGPPRSPGAQSQNFVLCPGKAYDRSPCGTGTSARLACLAADSRLAENEPYAQESILRTRFTGRYRWLDRIEGKIVPTMTGTAHVTAEATLILSEDDPFCWGIR
jgi:proline racemase